MDKDVIREVGDVLRSQRAELNAMKNALQAEADHENDEFKGATKQRLSKYAAILENQYEYIQNLFVVQTALRMQIETLKNVIYTLPDVMRDPELKRKIDSILKRYNDSI
ncbi:MAG: hypothetical protein WA941_13075 [Nitrososphaeraceae archaeon]